MFATKNATSSLLRVATIVSVNKPGSFYSRTRGLLTDNHCTYVTCMSLLFMYFNTQIRLICQQQERYGLFSYGRIALQAINMHFLPLMRGRSPIWTSSQHISDITCWNIFLDIQKNLIVFFLTGVKQPRLSHCIVQCRCIVQS